MFLEFSLNLRSGAPAWRAWWSVFVGAEAASRVDGCCLCPGTGRPQGTIVRAFADTKIQGNGQYGSAAAARVLQQRLIEQPWIVVAPAWPASRRFRGTADRCRVRARFAKIQGKSRVDLSQQSRGHEDSGENALGMSAEHPAREDSREWHDKVVAAAPLSRRFRGRRMSGVATKVASPTKIQGKKRRPRGMACSTV